MQGQSLSLDFADPPMFRHALFNQYNLILLGGAVLYALALWSPLPLEIAFAGEVLWLGLGARSAAFRRWVGAQAVRGEEARWQARVEAAAAGLDPDGAGRVRAVGAGFMDLARVAVERGADLTLGPGGVGRLEALLDAYGQLFGAHERLQSMVRNGRAAAVEEEMVRLAKSVVDERDPTVRVSLRQSLAMGQRRLKQIAQVDTARHALESKLSALETSLEHARAQVAAGVPGPQLSAHLGEMLAAAHFNAGLESDLAGGGAGASASVAGPARTTGSALIRPV